MRKEIKLLLIIYLIFTSCAITHHKKELIGFEENRISTSTLKLDGYYYSELECEYGEYPPFLIDEYYKKTGIKKIKYLSVFFIYEDGFVLNLERIDGLSHYYCAEKKLYENTYESAHKSVELMIESQNSEIRMIKRICGFKPNYINNKGLTQVKNDSIKIQFYRVEKQNLKKDSYNSYYLHEINGVIESESSFTIKSEIEFRNNKTIFVNKSFKFRETEQKPNIENYFKKNEKRFE